MSTVPARGDGISTVVLSVCTSTSGWSSSTSSPSATSQRGDLGLGEALAEIGEPELVRHGGRVVRTRATLRTASTTRSTDGMYQSSSCQYGYGTS